MVRVRFCTRPPFRQTAVILMGVLCVAGLGVDCHRRSAGARRESDRATAAAEAMAQQATITSAEVDASATSGGDETSAAFRLEQSDYRRRLQVALDQLDRAVLRSGRSRADAAPSGRHVHELRSRRALLRSDLEAVDRSTEQDWATLRTKLERDLDPGPH